LKDILNEIQTTQLSASRDAMRVADIRQIQVALELFYNDNKRYPKAENSQPAASDGKPTFSYYVASIPQAPEPADGSCSSDQNKFVYTQVNNGTDYSLGFCLGQAVGSYTAGPHTASASGIK